MRLALRVREGVRRASSASTPQDEALTEGWQMHEGYWSATLGLVG